MIVVVPPAPATVRTAFEDVVLQRQQARSNAEPSATEIGEDQLIKDESRVCWLHCPEGRSRQQDGRKNGSLHYNWLLFIVGLSHSGP